MNDPQSSRSDIILSSPLPPSLCPHSYDVANPLYDACVSITVAEHSQSLPPDWIDFKKASFDPQPFPEVTH